MENKDATYSMELVHTDYLMIEANEGGKEVYILVITDHFTWYAQVIDTSSQIAKCTAQIYGTNSLSIMSSLRIF